MVEITEAEYARLLAAAARDEDYTRATQYMTGYMAETLASLQRTHDPTLIERMKGRIEAVTAFDRRVVELAQVRLEH